MAERVRLLTTGVIVAAVVLAACSSATARTPAKHSPARWGLVALGDSIPYAAAEDCDGCIGYPTLLAQRIERDTGHPVNVRNDARHNSLSSPGLLALVKGDRAVRADIRAASIITITIGHNDTPWVLSDDLCDGPDSDQHANWDRYTPACVADAAAKLTTNLDRTLTAIVALREGRPTAIRVTNFYNDNEKDPLADPGGDKASKFVVDAFDRAICATARRHHVPCADIYHAFNGPDGTAFDEPYVAADHVHPNQRGQRLIADVIARVGYRGPDRTRQRMTFGLFDPVLGDFSLWSANLDGTNRKRLSAAPSFFSSWTSDGRRIAFDFVDDVGEHIATVDPDARHRRQLTFGRGIQEAPAWSHDRKWITYDESPLSPDDPSFSTSIWVMRNDGSGRRQLTRDAFDVEPEFSPNGTKIAFGRITGTNAQGVQQEALYVMDRDGTHPRRIASAALGVAHPHWSPDGRWIAFTTEPGGPESILAVHPNGSALHSLRAATNRLQFYKATWSPDGRQMLVGCNDLTSHVDKICRMNADGTHIRTVLDHSPLDANFPVWGKPQG